MAEIVPAIIAKNKQELAESIHLVEKEAGLVQLDIMDGVFVQNETWRAPRDLADIDTQITMEAHLMVVHPELVLDEWLASPVKRVLAHWEAVGEPGRAGLFRKMIESAHKKGKEFGVAINPETPTEEVEPLMDEIDAILFLSVHPGFYGKEFIPEIIPKIESFRNRHKRAIIEIDGGMKLSNVRDVARARIDRIVVGSAIFKAKDPLYELRELKKRSLS
jgi:ribulose-phosphate 3-epimerase